MSCLKDRRHSVKIIGIRNLFQLIKSGVPQGSILRPILFNIFINDLFHLLENDLHDFADNNTVSAVSETVPDLINSLTLESNLAIDWFQTNSVIINPDKSKPIILMKTKQDTSEIQSSLKGHCITSESSVSLLGVAINCRLSFEKHFGDLCKIAVSQLNALKRLHPYITHHSTRNNLIQSFVLSHFNYCPLVWYFTTAKQLQKIEKIQESALRFMTDDCLSSYETLLISIEITTMRIRQTHNLNPHYMQELSDRNSSSYSTRKPNDPLL